MFWWVFPCSSSPIHDKYTHLIFQYKTRLIHPFNTLHGVILRSNTPNNTFIDLDALIDNHYLYIYYILILYIFNCSLNNSNLFKY